MLLTIPKGLRWLRNCSAIGEQVHNRLSSFLCMFWCSDRSRPLIVVWNSLDTYTLQNSFLFMRHLKKRPSFRNLSHANPVNSNSKPLSCPPHSWTHLPLPLHNICTMLPFLPLTRLMGDSNNLTLQWHLTHFARHRINGLLFVHIRQPCKPITKARTFHGSASLSPLLPTTPVMASSSSNPPLQHPPLLCWISTPFPSFLLPWPKLLILLTMKSATQLQTFRRKPWLPSLEAIGNCILIEILLTCNSLIVNDLATFGQLYIVTIFKESY